MGEIRLIAIEDADLGNVIASVDHDEGLTYGQSQELRQRLLVAWATGVDEFEGKHLLAWLRRVVGNGPLPRLKRKFQAAFTPEEAE